MKSILGKLGKIQAELKVPKGQNNDFGGFKYRSQEDILEAVKPLLAKHNCALALTDDIVQLGDRYYIIASAAIYCVETGEMFTNKAGAREAGTKKGQDESQITGASSSYARKYALNGLFLIDDTKDADTMDNTAPKRTQEEVLLLADKATGARAFNALFKSLTPEEKKDRTIMLKMKEVQNLIKEAKENEIAQNATA